MSWLNFFNFFNLIFFAGYFDFEASQTSNSILPAALHNSVMMDSTKPPVYQCDTCPYSSNLLCNLKRHYLIHTGQKPYVCKFCCKSFNQKVTLTTHERLHTGEKPYPCNVCSLRFSNRASLIRHMAKHSNYK